MCLFVLTYLGIYLSTGVWINITNRHIACKYSYQICPTAYIRTAQYLLT